MLNGEYEVQFKHWKRIYESISSTNNDSEHDFTIIESEHKEANPWLSVSITNLK